MPSLNAKSFSGAIIRLVNSASMSIALGGLLGALNARCRKPMIFCGVGTSGGGAGTTSSPFL